MKKLLLVFGLMLLASPVLAEDVTLLWTAPGDDGNIGTATAYDLRRSTAMLTSANFSAATQVVVTAPKVAGSPETFVVTGLTPGTYYFAIKSVDEAGNWSLMSNVVAKVVADVTPPSTIVDLR